MVLPKQGQQLHQTDNVVLRTFSELVELLTLTLTLRFSPALIKTLRFSHRATFGML